MSDDRITLTDDLSVITTKAYDVDMKKISLYKMDYDGNKYISLYEYSPDIDDEICMYYEGLPLVIQTPYFEIGEYTSIDTGRRIQLEIIAESVQTNDAKRKCLNIISMLREKLDNTKLSMVTEFDDGPLFETDEHGKRRKYAENFKNIFDDKYMKPLRFLVMITSDRMIIKQSNTKSVGLLKKEYDSYLGLCNKKSWNVPQLVPVLWEIICSFAFIKN